MNSYQVRVLADQPESILHRLLPAVPTRHQAHRFRCPKAANHLTCPVEIVFAQLDIGTRDVAHERAHDLTLCPLFRDE